MKKEMLFKEKECNENKCTVDPNMKVCLHCFRTVEEIDFWDDYSKVDQMMIFRAAEKRRKLFEEFQDKVVQDLSFIL
jgi:predicted Fe-S protein YdhL (DUF1289 family)